MENIGKIEISKSTGSTNLFAHPTKVSSIINIRFKTGEVSNSFNRINVFPKKEVLEAQLSKEQWSSLLLNTNNQNGVPCTLAFREDEKVGFSYTVTETEEKSNDYGNILKEFKNELLEIFPTSFTIKEESKKILRKEEQTAKDRKDLKILLDKYNQEFSENEAKINELIQKYFDLLNNIADKDLVSDIKSNFLGFASIENREKAQHLLGILSKDKNLIELGSENKKLPINLQHGVIKLEEVKSEVGFVGDEDSENGYKISVCQAIEEIINGVKTIIAGEVLVSYQMSVSQFSEFITSFNQGTGEIATITYRKTIGDIDFESLSIDNLSNRIKELETYVSSISEKILDKTEELDQKLKRKIGVRKIREVEIDFEQFYNYIPSNLPFYMKEVLEARISDNISRRMDIQFSVEKTIKDLGVEALNQKIVKKDFSDLEKMLGNKSLKRLS